MAVVAWFLNHPNVIIKTDKEQLGEQNRKTHG